MQMNQNNSGHRISLSSPFFAVSEVREKSLQTQSGYLCVCICSCTHLLKSGCMPLMLNSAPKISFLCGSERFALFMFVPLSLTVCFCLSVATKPHCFGALTGTR